MKKRTASNRDQVRAWIETTPHNEVLMINTRNPDEVDKEGHPVFTHVVLRSHFEQLRIPVEIWRTCYTRVGGNFDTRIYRWDFATEMESKELWGEARRYHPFDSV